MRKLLLFMLCTMLVATTLLAQNVALKGKVTDDAGKPLSGASVVVKGTSLGANTDGSGSFSLNVPTSAKVLVFSFSGFATQEVTIGNRREFLISLVSDSKDLDEVVVVGYQARKKRDEAGAVSTVRAAQIENLPNISLDKALQGKAAGVLVQANNGIPGGAINVRIRGQGSISAGNDPLYIVDGVQINTRSDANFTQSNPLAFLNPDDIESIDILKDAASAAIYGSNAANGVVIVTTKKGKAGKTKFTFNAFAGQARPLKYLDMANSQDYYRLRAEAVGVANSLPWDNLAVKRFVLNELRVPGAGTMTDVQADAAAAALQTYDWQRAAFSNAPIQNYEISASGGNDKTTFRVSANYSLQGTVISKADFERFGVKADITNRATDKLTFSTTLNLSTFDQNLPFATDGSFLGNPAFSASGIIPSNPIKNADGSFYGVPGQNPASLIGVLNQNIIQVNEYNTGFNRTNQIVGNFRIDYKFNDWLSYSGQANLDYRFVTGKLVRDPRTADGFGLRGLVQTEAEWNTNWGAFQTLNFNKTFDGKHRVDGLLGMDFRKENQQGITATGNSLPSYQFTNLNNAAVPSTTGEFFTGYRRIGYFASANYSYNRKYVVGVNLRRDGSSRFGSGNQFGTYYGVKAAWNVDQESFLKNNKHLTALKLRTSYGSTGNDQVGNFDWRGLYGGGGIYNGSAGINFSQFENANLSWETSSLFNIGADLTLWNRINLSLEWYNKINSDLLLPRYLPAYSSGITGVSENIGKVQNTGLEITLGGDLVQAKRKGDFNWNVNFTYSSLKNKVKELLPGTKELAGSPNIRVGEPINVLFTFPYAGVNASTGRPMWYDSLGNVTYQPIAKDRRIIGPQNLPRHFGGLRNTFSYKGFTLDVFFQYEYGRYVSDGQVNFLTENLARINMVQEVVDNRWTTPGQITWYPRMNANGAEAKGVGAQGGTRTFFKADYIRLKNLLLSYDLSEDVLKRFKLNSARFYVQATNLFTYSDWFSYDVEFVGTATGIIPQTKNFTVGVQLGF
jgi:TonB-dependent starch-binding outer membrane protein SusC